MLDFSGDEVRTKLEVKLGGEIRDIAWDAEGQRISMVGGEFHLNLVLGTRLMGLIRWERKVWSRLLAFDWIFDWRDLWS